MQNIPVCLRPPPRDLLPAEHDTILAALRFWQMRELDPHNPVKLLHEAHGEDLTQDCRNIAAEHGPALDADQVDDLCERLICGQIDPKIKP